MHVKIGKNYVKSFILRTRVYDSCWTNMSSEISSDSISDVNIIYVRIIIKGGTDQTLWACISVVHKFTYGNIHIHFFLNVCVPVHRYKYALSFSSFKITYYRNCITLKYHSELLGHIFHLLFVDHVVEYLFQLIYCIYCNLLIFL